MTDTTVVSADRVHVPHLERHAYNQMPKTGYRSVRLLNYKGSDLYQWWGKKADSVFEDPDGEPFRILAAQPSAGAQAEDLSARILEAVAHNLCSLHDFDPEFVKGQERFARAVISEYLAAQSGSGVDNNPLQRAYDVLANIRGDEARDDLESAINTALADIRKSIRATPSQPDTGDVAALREALEDAIALLWEHVPGIAPRIEPLEAALSKPNAPGREG